MRNNNIPSLPSQQLLGNVVGLIKSATAPEKKYVLWAQEVPTEENPEAVILRFYNYSLGQWKPVSEFEAIAADPDGFWPAFLDANSTLLWILSKLKGQAVAAVLPTPAAPRIISQNDSNNTILFEAPSGWLITDCGYSIKDAATVNATSATIQVGDVALTANQVRIFVRATATNYEGRSAYNSAGFTVTQVTNLTPLAPTLVALDDVANTFKFAPPAGYTVTQCVYTLNGSAAQLCTSDTLQVGNIAVATGQLKVYVPAGPGVNRGDILTNATAFTKLVAPPVEPTFNTTYSPGDNISTATWLAQAGWQLLLNLPLSTNPDPNPATMRVFFAGTQIGKLDYNGADTGKQFAGKFNGTTYLGNLTNGDVTLS